MAFKPSIRFDKRHIVDHLLSSVHEECLRVNNAQKQWNKHPWIQLLKKQKAETVRLLTRLAIDVYNDSRSLTFYCMVMALKIPVTRCEWSSVSLTELHSQRVTNSICSSSADDSTLNLLSHPHQQCTVSPDAYREMLDIIGSLEWSAVKERLEMCDTFSIQVDGSVDKWQTDNKFICARVIQGGKAESVFIGVCESKNRGAEGLLEATCSAFGKIVNNVKCTSCTTDGASENTGCKNGFWKLLADHLGHKIVCYWCAGHRSDLAYEDVEKCIGELKLLHVEMTSVCSYFRASAVRTKEFHEIATEAGITAKQFPFEFEVRFAQHLLQITETVLHN